MFHIEIRNHLLKTFLCLFFSAGVGRSGTFIALDCLMDQAEAEKMVDIMGCVSKLRHKRCYMVQTLVSTSLGLSVIPGPLEDRHGDLSGKYIRLDS